MRINVTFAFALMLGLTLGIGGCKKRVVFTGNDVKSSPEGAACPKDVGLIADGERPLAQLDPA